VHRDDKPPKQRTFRWTQSWIAMVFFFIFATIILILLLAGIWMPLGSVHNHILQTAGIFLIPTVISIITAIVRTDAFLHGNW
jgi:sterol desaturase/sphingolipid hydroxylase (fatty acid hydroxylase superfamily)